MRARELDMTHGSLWDKILIFAFPLALTAFLQQLYNTADVLAVGRFVGTDAMAAIGTNVSVLALLVNLLMGLSLGANVMIARFIGGGETEKARRALHTSLLLALFTGLAIFAVGELFAHRVLTDALGVPPEIMGYAEAYLRICLVGMPFLGLYNFLAAIFRSCGDTRTPLIALAAASALNAALNVLFAGYFTFGIAGVAWATVIAQAASAAILWRGLRQADGIIHLDLKALHWDWARTAEIVRMGLPAGVQAMVFSLSNIVIQSAINSLGTDAMAASSAAFTIEINAYCMVFAFSQATTTFVSQNYGAGKLFRCRRVTWLCFGLGCFFMLLIAAPILYFGEVLLSLFDAEPAVIAFGMIRLWYVVGPEFLNCIMDILSGSLRGYGFSLPPAILAIIGICGVRIVWVYTVFAEYQDFEVLMTCYALSWAVTGVFMALAYRFYTRNLKRIRAWHD